MKRKTNLFYTSGPDSKFLTFSNYTESLTGNFISTDHKLFPCKFLCMNIENLTDETKPSFIKLLCSYYENKMAVLRDDSLSKNVNIETKALPLAYLVECLIHIEFDEESGSFMWNNDTVESILESSPEKKNMFNFVGDIAEEDYDGTYSDIICYIDLATQRRCEIENISEQVSDTSVVSITDNITDRENLYGWTNSTSPSSHGDIIDTYDNLYDQTGKQIQDAVLPIFDVNNGDECYYNYTSTLDRLKIIDENKDSLTFNAIIPLYDLVNINYESNHANLIDHIDSIDLQRSDSYSCPYNYNVPLGIWLSTVPVSLEIDKDTMMSPTWSLLISSQFKALPYYSKNLFESGIENQKILESSSKKMFNTFASVIVRQNKLVDMFTKMQGQILDLQKRLELIQNQISVVGTDKNIDSLHIEQTNFESDMRKEFESFKDEVHEYFKNIIWKATI